jgi:hypothetical protein
MVPGMMGGMSGSHVYYVFHSKHFRDLAACLTTRLGPLVSSTDNVNETPTSKLNYAASMALLYVSFTRRQDTMRQLRLRYTKHCIEDTQKPIHYQIIEGAAVVAGKAVLIPPPVATLCRLSISMAAFDMLSN